MHLTVRSAAIGIGGAAVVLLSGAPSAGSAGICTTPRVTGMRVIDVPRARTVVIRVRAQDSDGRIASLDIDWGDRRLTHADLVSSGSPGDSSMAELEHRYRRRGSFLVGAVASSAPAAGCGEAVERSPRKRLRVRAW